jgi:hypothetical protein
MQLSNSCVRYNPRAGDSQADTRLSQRFADGFLVIDLRGGAPYPLPLSWSSSDFSSFSIVASWIWNSARAGLGSMVAAAASAVQKMRVCRKNNPPVRSAD